MQPRQRLRQQFPHRHKPNRGDSVSMDISDFYQTFFDEADELLADMEQHLLDLVPEAPDSEQLNAIFRAAHSIKGGAGTFGFTILQETTHLMENLLDEARRGEMQLNTDIINLFWKPKILCRNSSTPIKARKSQMPPALNTSAMLCASWRWKQRRGCSAAASAAKLSVVDAAASESETAAAPAAESDGKLRIVLSRLKESEIGLLEEELSNLGTLSDVVKGTDTLSVTLDGGVGEDDIIAVLCFVIEADQIAFEKSAAASAPAAAETAEAATAAVDDATEAAPQAVVPVVKPAAAPALKAVAKEQPAGREKPAARASESTSIRVAVEKVDQLINLGGRAGYHPVNVGAAFQRTGSGHPWRSDHQHESASAQRPRPAGIGDVHPYDADGICLQPFPSPGSRPGQQAG